MTVVKLVVVGHVAGSVGVGWSTTSLLSAGEGTIDAGDNVVIGGRCMWLTG